MRYLGSKDKLLPAIQSLLYEKGLLNHSFRFFDAFCGTGSVANSLKNIYKVIINDSMRWSVLYAKGRIIGKSCAFKNLGFNPFQYFSEHQDIEKGFFYQNYSPGGSDRMYFTSENAGRIDYIRSSIEQWKHKNLISDNEFAYLIYCLIEGVSSVANTAGVFGSFLKHWDPRSQRKLQYAPISENLFDEVSSDYHIETYSSKIEDIITQIECDILYLDPPYTQNQYGTQYHLLETLVLNDNPKISKITGSRPVTPMKSLWSKDLYTHVLFDYIVANTTAKYVILSYNNDGFMSKEFIEATLKRYGNVDTYECVEIDYKKYNNFKCRGREGHLEYLFFVEKKSAKDVIFESPLNYSGSKAKMIPNIKSLLPTNIETFVDVFGGGFNVGINVTAKKVIYNDINQYVVGLINSFYENDPIVYFKAINKLIKEYSLAPNNKEGYLRIRDKYNSMPKSERSAIMLYTLILFGFQQQIRFNSEHGFNIPCGSRRFNDKIIAKFISFSRMIKSLNVEFRNNSFIDLTPLIEADTFFYLDPPYRETTATYNDGKRGFEGWSVAHEKELCNFIDKINLADAKFMFSYILQSGDFHNYEVENWATKRGYNIIHIDEPQGRYNDRKEVLITNYKK